MTNPVNKVNADIPVLGRLLQVMMDLVMAHGGQVHPGVRLVARDGQLAVHCNRSMCDDDLPLFRLPRELLVPVDPIQWASRDDRLQAIEGLESLTAVQRELLGMHVDLYNASDKLPWAAKHLPVVALRSHAPLVDAIQAIRPGFGRNPSQTALAFLGTRVFNLEGRWVLMPLMDLLNHHPKGGRFQVDASSMTMGVVQPGEGDECFASYGGRRDVLDMALHYGYADVHTPFACIAPLACVLPELGRLQITSRRVQALHPLDPPQITYDDEGVTLSHLTGDRRHPGRLHTVLRLALLGLSKKRGLDGAGAERAVCAATQQILELNLALLQDVARLAGPLIREVPAAAMLSEAVVLQAGILRDVLQPAAGDSS
jgi:hypothetical protein